jgi:distribution and morphology protein 31
VPIDHVNHLAEGPLGWITSGKLDIDLHILFPHTQETRRRESIAVALESMVKEEIEEIKEIALEKLNEIKERIPERTMKRILEVTKLKERARPSTLPPTAVYGVLYPTTSNSTAVQQGIISPSIDDSGGPNVVMYWNVRLNDLKASVPLTTPDLSYLSNAMIRPVVSYLNLKETSRLDLLFSTELDLVNFDGSVTWYEAGVMDVLAREVGLGVTKGVYDGVVDTLMLPGRFGWWGVRGLVGLFGWYQ